MRITGPGLASPIVIHGNLGDPLGDRFWNFATLAFPSMASSSNGYPSVETLPVGTQLGPAYSIAYKDPCCGFQVRQILYPYATGGPWTFTPAGQGRDLVQMNFSDVLGLMPSGWFKASPVLWETLTANGLPAPQSTTPPPSGDDRPDATIWLVAGIGSLLAAALLLVRRHRRATGAHLPA